MQHGRAGAIALALAAVVQGSALAGGPPGPLKDWPCPAPFADRLTPEAIWPTALPGTVPADDVWKADPKARAIVEFVAASENSPRMGTQYIEDFAKANGAIRPDFAMLVLSGIVEQANKLRDILIEGIHTNVVRSHILAGAVQQNDEHLAHALQQPGDDATAVTPDEIRKARLANLRSLDDAGDSADMLCHRYSYDESKARTLAAALQRQMQ
jgi:hypothetical protein